MSVQPPAVVPQAVPVVGVEWLVEAFDCDLSRLRSASDMQALCERALKELGLTAIGHGLWHTFPFPGGVTGFYLLTESHLACHTYPEHGLATFNLYCCRPRELWPWDARLKEAIGAKRVMVRSMSRGGFLPSPLGGEGDGASPPGEGTRLQPPSPHPRPLSPKGRGGNAGGRP